MVCKIENEIHNEKSFSFTIPRVFTTPLNGNRLHWTKLKKRKDADKEAAFYYFHWAFLNFKHQHKADLTKKLRVTFCRLSCHKMDKGDNLSSAFKWARDTIAKCLGIDDGSDLIEWCYSQRLVKQPLQGVQVMVEFEVSNIGPIPNNIVQDELNTLYAYVKAILVTSTQVDTSVINKISIKFSDTQERLKQAATPWK